VRDQSKIQLLAKISCLQRTVLHQACLEERALEEIRADLPHRDNSALSMFIPAFGGVKKLDNWQIFLRGERLLCILMCCCGLGWFGRRVPILRGGGGLLMLKRARHQALIGERLGFLAAP
jgi:hypothetical protein